MRNVYIATLMFGLMVPLVAYQNCGSLQSASFNVSESTLESLSSSDRVVDLETLLTGLVEQERRERMQADSALENRINALEELVSQNRVELEEQIDVIEQTQNLMQADIDAMKLEFDQKLNAMMVYVNDLVGQLNINIADLKEYTDSRIEFLASDVESQMDGLVSFLSAEVQASEDADLARHQELLGQISTISQELVLVKNSHEDLLAYVNQTFVTKDEFAQLQASYLDLKSIAENLDMKIDQTKEELESQLGEELILVREQISAIHLSIQDLTLADENMAAQLDQVVADYKAELDTMGGTLRQLIFDTEEKVLYLVAQGDERTRHELLEAIRVEATKQTLYIKSSIASFAEKIRILETEISTKTDTVEVTALEAQLQSAKQEISLLIASEQNHRDELQNQVDKLAEEISQVKKDVETVHLITLENRNMIDNLTIAFDDHKAAVATKFGVLEADVDAKIAGLRADFEEQLDDVMVDVDELGEGLGAGFQEHLAGLVQEVAILKNQVANHDQTLINLAQAQRDDNAKLIQLQGQVDALTVNLSQDISVVINKYLKIQEIFMTILAPNDRNLQAWDIDFKQFMPICGGDANLSFPNAMGMESYQFINLEFSRLLLSGVRSGTEADGIFHNYGEAFQGTGFHRTIVTAMTNQAYGNANGDCLNKIQHWARRIIFESKEFNLIRQRMRDSGALAASIEELYRSLAEIKGESDQITQMILNFTAGMFNEAKVYNTLLAQYAVKFINFGMNRMTIVNKVQHINKTTIIQREIGGIEKFEVLFQRMMGKLDGFALKSTTRIRALERRVGNLSAQMAMVLRHLNCTSAKGCLGPIAIQPINPIVIAPPPPPPACTAPKVAFVQHFFTSPFASKAIKHWGQWEHHRQRLGIQKVDSPTKLCEATAQAALEDLNDLNINAKRHCWVNFRNIPKPEWGNAIGTFGLRIHGQMNKARIQCEGAFDKTVNLDEASEDVVMYGNNLKGIFDIKLPNALTGKNFDEISQAENRTQNCTVTPICTQSGDVYNYEFVVWSPLVLDFKVSGSPDLTTTFGGVEFDLNADGVLDKSAWIQGSTTGLLVYDRNNDGRINDGSELFGQSTFPNQEKNGFQALAHFDSNKDNVIDEKDSIFPKLQVWFDLNTDGVSQANELKSLAEKEVQSISLSYNENSLEKQFSVADSNIKYSAKFTGPKICGDKGCNIHDIYFGKINAKDKLAAE